VPLVETLVYSANYHRGLEHSANPEEIDDLEKFLGQCLPKMGDMPGAGL